MRKISLAIIALSATLAIAASAEAKMKSLFKASQPCAKELSDDYGFTFDDFWCLSTFPAAFSLDLTAAPFIISANLSQGNTTEQSTNPGNTSTDASNKASASSSDGSSKKDKEAQVKDYKKTLVYAISDDAVYFTASEGREPSTALRQVLIALQADFPGESDQEIASRIVGTHLNTLKYLSELE